jgi:hypothetical protein
VRAAGGGAGRWAVDAVSGERDIADERPDRTGRFSPPPSDRTGMTSIDEKRVYTARAGKRDAFVATAMGVVVVAVSGDVVGDFGLEHRVAASAASARGGRVAIATEEGIVIAAGGSLHALGFGPAVAVGLHDEAVLAADAEGRIARRPFPAAVRAAGDDDPSASTAGRDRRPDETRGGGNDGVEPDAHPGAEPDVVDGEGEGASAWTTIGRVERVRAIDGGLVAAADGVYRVTADGIAPGGLSDVRDVAAAGRPLAATGDGLYALGNGWLRDLSGRFRAVASDPRSDPGADATAAGTEAVAVGDEVYVAPAGTSTGGRHGSPDGGGDATAGGGGAGAGDGEGEDGDWRVVDCPTGDPVVDVAVVDGVWYGVTEGGTFLVDAGDGPRTQPLGLNDVAALAVR